MDNQVEIFYVIFYSECCGIDTESLKLLQETEKKYLNTFTKKVNYWGKEGEVIFFYSSNKSKELEFCTFYNEILTLINNQEKLVLVGVAFTQNALENYLTIVSTPLSLNKINEEVCLEAIQPLLDINKITLRKENINYNYSQHTSILNQITIQVNKLTEEEKINICNQIKLTLVKIY